jgi:hypothetical protein
MWTCGACERSIGSASVLRAQDDAEADAGVLGCGCDGCGGGCDGGCGCSRSRSSRTHRSTCGGSGSSWG